MWQGWLSEPAAARSETAPFLTWNVLKLLRVILSF
jgi:hypothetical protein